MAEAAGGSAAEPTPEATPAAAAPSADAPRATAEAPPAAAAEAQAAVPAKEAAPAAGEPSPAAAAVEVPAAAEVPTAPPAKEESQSLAVDIKDADAFAAGVPEIERLSGAKVTLAPGAGADGKQQVTMVGTAIAVARAKVLIEDKLRGTAPAQKAKEAEAAEEPGSKAVMLAGSSFKDRAALMDHIKSVQTSVTEGAMLGPEDAFFIFHLSTFHPQFMDKMIAPVVGFKYAEHESFPGSKCFFVVRADGTEEGISISKCINVLFPKDSKGTKRPREEEDAAAAPAKGGDAAAGEAPQEKKQKREREIIPGCILLIEGVPKDFPYKMLREKLEGFGNCRFLELLKPKVEDAEDGDDEEDDEEEGGEAEEKKGEAAADPPKEPKEDAAATKDAPEEAPKQAQEGAKEGGDKEGASEAPKPDDQGAAKESTKEGEGAKEGAGAKEGEAAAAKAGAAKPAGKEQATCIARARFYDAAGPAKAAKELKDLDGSAIACKVLEGDEERAFWERLWEQADGQKGKGKGKGKKGGGKGGSVDCFICGGDHFARDCPEGGSKGKGGGKSVDCFICGGPHFARDCPEGGGKGKGGKGKSGGGGGICYDFRDRGECRFGENCRFSHDA